MEGNGGGMDRLREMQRNDDKQPSMYRPWKTRFDLQPYDVNNAAFLKPENRMGYRRFYAASPDLALVPNTRDREAQSTTIMMFVMTALAAILCGIWLINGLQVLDAATLDVASYQILMARVIALATLPWLVLGMWLLSVFAGHVANPMRNPHMPYHWQCNAMTWFLLVAPIVNTLYFGAHAMWLSKLFFNIESEPTGFMGRMLLPGFSMDKNSNDPVGRIFSFASTPLYRHTLFFLQVVCAISGYMLISFRYGSNSQFCHPEVYWATTALVATSVIIIVFASLAFVCSVVVGIYATAPWLQDFLSSFREDSLLPKMRREEQLEKEEAKAARMKAAAQPESNGHWGDADWSNFQDQFEEERKRHEAIMAEHAAYNEAMKQKAPQHPRHALPLAPEAVEEDETPLLIWDDSVSEQDMQEPASVTASGALDPVTDARSTSPLSSQNRLISPFAGMIPGVIRSQPVIMSSSLSPLTSQVANVRQQWSSERFTMAYAQRPSSAPVLMSSQTYAIASGAVIPATVHFSPAMVESESPH